MVIEKRYRILRFIALLLKIFAWLALLIGIFGSFGVAFSVSSTSNGLKLQSGMPGLESWMIGGAMLVFGVLTSLFYFSAMFAAGELLTLALAIEENTRATMLWLQSQARPVAPAPPTPQVYNPAVLETPPPPFAH